MMLSGKRAIVTGGSRGIGAAIVRAFAAEGCDVAFCHVGDDSRAAALAEEVRRSGQKAHAAVCDIGDEAAIRAFVADCEASIGSADILVNNAGISGESPFESISLAALDRMLAVNLRGAILMAQAVYPAMKARRYGRIINVASQLAYKGGAGLVHYTAAKAGIVGFTRALALEAAPHGVLVNGIAPGPIDTALMDDLTEEWKATKKAGLPLGRFGRPEEIAPSAVLLASAGGSYYVGQMLSPNGGDVFL